MSCEHTDVIWAKDRGNVVVCQSCGMEFEYYYDEVERRVLKRTINRTEVAMKKRATEPIYLDGNEVSGKQEKRPRKVQRGELLEIGPKAYAERYGYMPQQSAFLYNLYRKWGAAAGGDGLKAHFEPALEFLRTIMPEPGTPLSFDKRDALLETVSGIIKVMYPLVE